MLSRKQIESIRNIDPEYIIGGSSAVMIYAGRDVRRCNDVDIISACPSIKERLNGIGMGNTDVSREGREWQEKDGVRLVRLEDLIAYKMNRYAQLHMPKDLFDLYFLFDTGYDAGEVKKRIGNEIPMEGGCGESEYQDFLKTAFEKVRYGDCIARYREHADIISR